MCTPQTLGTYTEKLVLTGARERIAKKIGILLIFGARQSSRECCFVSLV
jgi:hypothetical protein